MNRRSSTGSFLLRGILSALVLSAVGATSLYIGSFAALAESEVEVVTEPEAPAPANSSDGASDSDTEPKQSKTPAVDTNVLRKRYPKGMKVDAQIPSDGRWLHSVVMEHEDGKVCVDPPGWPPGSGDCVEESRIAPRGKKTPGLKSTPPNDEDRQARAASARAVHERPGDSAKAARNAVCAPKNARACNLDSNCILERGRCRSL